MGDVPFGLVIEYEEDLQYAEVGDGFEMYHGYDQSDYSLVQYLYSAACCASCGWPQVIGGPFERVEFISDGQVPTFIGRMYEECANCQRGMQAEIEFFGGRPRWGIILFSHVEIIENCELVVPFDSAQMVEWIDNDYV